MKKVLMIILLAFSITVTGCSAILPEEKRIEVKNGCIDISVTQFENDFNDKISNDYAKANLSKRIADAENTYYDCTLSGNVELSILSTPDSSMIYMVSLSFNPKDSDDAAHNSGYYYAKVLYTVAPDITDEEIMNIAKEIGMDLPLPGSHNVEIRNDIIYSMKVEDDGTISLSAIGNK